MASTVDTHERAKGLTEVADRVDYIADLMAEFRWVRGKTGKVLAQVWGCTVAAVQNYSAEASRRVTAGADEVRREVTTRGVRMLKSAYDRDNAKDFAAVAKILADVSGANAPEKHEVIAVSSGVATPERARQVMQELFGSVTPSLEPESGAEPAIQPGPTGKPESGSKP